MKKNIYPIITEQNFEEMTKRLVFKDKWQHSNSSYPSHDYSIRVKKPTTRDEFYDMTKNMFGVGLTFTGSPSSSYQICEKQDWYAKLPIPVLWGKKYGQYDGLTMFLNRAFGDLYCGGVAGSHYGQYITKGHRDDLRLKKLYSSTLSICSPTSSNQT